jgi:hypothetical protein
LFSGAEASAIIRDIVLYASHPDPQLKGNCSIIIGNLIAAILTEGRGNFDKWVKLHTDKTGKIFKSCMTLYFFKAFGTNTWPYFFVPDRVCKIQGRESIYTRFCHHYKTYNVIINILLK